MAKTQAERAKAYRDGKRDGNVTVRDGDSAKTVTKRDVTLSATVTVQSGPEPTGSDPEPAAIEQTDNPVHNELLNYGPHMDADELQVHKDKNKLKSYHNRVPLPGDSDYRPGTSQAYRDRKNKPLRIAGVPC